MVLSNNGDYTTPNTMEYSNRNNVVHWNKHMAKWTNPFKLMPTLDPESKERKKTEQHWNLTHRFIASYLSTPIDHWSFEFYNNVIDLAWQFEQYELAKHSIRISNKCVICSPGPWTHLCETVCKWHHQLSVWHYLDIHFGVWVFINA